MNAAVKLKSRHVAEMTDFPREHNSLESKWSIMPKSDPMKEERHVAEMNDFQREHNSMKSRRSIMPQSDPMKEERKLGQPWCRSPK